MRTVLDRWPVLVATLAISLVLASCGSGGGSSDRAQVVVTTNILGDVVQNLVGEDVTVEVIMPPGSSPHDFAPSAQQAVAMREADVLVVNGLGFEGGLVDTIEAAEADGVVVLSASDAIEPLPADDHAHDHEDHGEHEDHEDHEDHEQDEHEDHEHTVGDGHEHGDEDPHFFTDPLRMAAAVEHLADELGEHVDGLAGPAFDERVAGYVADLDALHNEVEELLAPIPEDRRVMVTNHEVFGYFADRYDLEVLGALIPGGSTLAQASGGEVSALADLIEAAGVTVVFADTSSPTRLADALAGEGAGVQVVELFSESLGDADSGAATYIDMVRTNAGRIAGAILAGDG